MRLPHRLVDHGRPWVVLPRGTGPGAARSSGSFGGPSHPCIPNRILRVGMSTTREDHQAETGPFPRTRAIFISDVHLGTRAAQAERLLDFLRHYECDVIY